MSTFHLVRHAHAVWQLDEKQPLSVKGSHDANRVADILQQYPINVIYSSPFCRARQTITPLANRLSLPVQIEPDLRERRLYGSTAPDFFKAAAATWQDPFFVHPGGEANAAAQQRGLTVFYRLQKQHPKEHIVISTHGNLMALILQVFDPSVNFAFWKSLTLPDIYTISFNQAGGSAIHRLWQETEG